MAKKNNTIDIKATFEGAYIRTRIEDDVTIYIASEAAFATIRWNCQALEDDGINLIQDEEDENLWTISNGEETIFLKVEKQIHQKVGKTWKIDGEKFSDGVTIKLNGTIKGDFEVWTNQNLNKNGKRTWKRISVAKTEDQGKENLKKAISEYEGSLKVKEA